MKYDYLYHKTEMRLHFETQACTLTEFATRKSFLSFSEQLWNVTEYPEPLFTFSYLSIQNILKMCLLE